MGSHIIESKLFRNSFGTEQMRAIFSDENQVQKWLDVEAALAKAEAELGLIPREAADEIVGKSSLEYVNMEKLGEQIQSTSHPLIPIIKQLEKACTGEYGQYVHWGATTQDVMDTATILQIKEALAVVENRIRDMMKTLIRLAEEHVSTIMPGRTHGQHALPITFGYKASVWLEEMYRHEERLQNMKQRVLTGQFGGAVGTLASLNRQGLDVQKRMMDHLGLETPRIAWHTSRDNLVEVASWMGMVMGTVGKIAKEIILLQKTEIGELEESFKKGQVGSSTMPHKRNPMVCQTIVTLSKVVASNSSLLMANMVHEHERDMVAWQVEWEAIPEIFIMGDAALSMIGDVLQHLRVNPEKMKANLMITDHMILSESIMLALGQKIGKQRSHHLIQEICMKALELQKPFAALLCEEEEISQHLSREEIESLLDPENYIGLSIELANNVVSHVKQRVFSQET